jgi:hypothetical protein
MKEEIASACVAVGPRGSGANHNASGTTTEKKYPVSLRVEVKELFVCATRSAVEAAMVIRFSFGPSPPNSAPRDDRSGPQKLHLQEPRHSQRDSLDSNVRLLNHDP